MEKSKTEKPAKKNHRALRKLVNSVAVAGALYAAEKFIEYRGKKKKSEKK